MSKTKERIHDSNLRYKQGLGQNFIYDEDLLAALVASSEITKDDDVLEIGPGAGSMTKYLCDAAHHVLSIELDERLIPLLTAFLAERDNFTLVQGDVMTLNLADVTKDLRKPLSVVANIPYYITTPLLTMLLASPIPIQRMALMVQKEVADKVMAQPGDDGWDAQRSQPVLLRPVSGHGCTGKVLYARAEGGQRVHRPAVAGNAGGTGAG